MLCRMNARKCVQHTRPLVFAGISTQEIIARQAPDWWMQRKPEAAWPCFWYKANFVKYNQISTRDYTEVQWCFYRNFGATELPSGIIRVNYVMYGKYWWIVGHCCSVQLSRPQIGADTYASLDVATTRDYAIMAILLSNDQDKSLLLVHLDKFFTRSIEHT